MKMIRRIARWMVEGYEGESLVGTFLFYGIAVVLGLAALVGIWRAEGLHFTYRAAVPVVAAIAALEIFLTLRLKKWLSPPAEEQPAAKKRQKHAGRGSGRRS